MRSVVAAIVFVIVTIVMSVLSIPAAVIDRTGRSYLWLARIWSKIFLLLFGVKLKVIGAENIRKGIPTVYVANHASYADAPAVLAAVPDNVRLMFRDSLTRIPIWGWALRLSPFLLISRTNATKAKASLENATRVIRSGAAVLLFPEGTRTADGEVQSFKRGAFKIAIESGAQVIPVAIIGTFELLPRTETLPNWGRPIEIRIGAPIKLEIGSEGRAAEIQLAALAEESLRALIEG